MCTDLSGSLALDGTVGDKWSFCVCVLTLRGVPPRCGEAIRCKICSHIRRFHLNGFYFVGIQLERLQRSLWRRHRP